MIKTILSADAMLKHNYHSCFPNRGVSSACFEVFVHLSHRCCSARQILGYDIILDSNLNPWVLEVNHSPSFTCDSPLDKEVLHHHFTTQHHHFTTASPPHHPTSSLHHPASSPPQIKEEVITDAMRMVDISHKDVQRCKAHERSGSNHHISVVSHDHRAKMQARISASIDGRAADASAKVCCCAALACL